MSWLRWAWAASFRSTSVRRSVGNSLSAPPQSCSIWRLSSRTRSTIRARRAEVEKINVPQAEMSTAGVIMAVNRLSAVGRSCIGASYSVSGLPLQGRMAEARGPLRCGCTLLANGFPNAISCAAVLLK